MMSTESNRLFAACQMCLHVPGTVRLLRKIAYSEQLSESLFALLSMLMLVKALQQEMSITPKTFNLARPNKKNFNGSTDLQFVHLTMKDNALVLGQTCHCVMSGHSENAHVLILYHMYIDTKEQE